MLADVVFDADSVSGTGRLSATTPRSRHSRARVCESFILLIDGEPEELNVVSREVRSVTALMPMDLLKRMGTAEELRARACGREFTYTESAKEKLRGLHRAWQEFERKRSADGTDEVDTGTDDLED